MADSTTTNVNNISDLPEYIKPYNQLLLNAVTGLVFDPKYTAAQLGATLPPTSTTGATSGNGNSVQYPSQDANNVQSPYTQQSTVSRPTSTASRMFTPAQVASGNQPVSNGSVTDNVLQLLNQRVFHRMAAGGSVAPMVRSMIGGNAYNTGIGATVNPGAMQPDSPVTYGGGQSGITYISPSGPVLQGSPIVTNPTPPPAYQTSGNTAVPQTTGVGVTPTYHPQGATQGSQFQPLPGAQQGQMVPTPGTPGLPNPQISQNKYEALGFVPAGFNKGNVDVPTSVAQQMAQQIGGKGVVETNPQGPNGIHPNPQSLIDMGGDLYLNAAQIQQMQQMFGDDWQKHVAADVAANRAPQQNYTQPGSGLGKFACGGITGLAKPVQHFDTGGYADPGVGATPTTTPPVNNGFGAGIFQPYQPYGGQRILSSDPNADPTTTWTTSPRTQQAESQMSGLPQEVNSAGQITDPNLAHARDLMGYSADQTGSIWQNLSNLANSYDPANTHIKSQYQQMNYGPSQFTAPNVDPSKLQMGSAGQVKLDPLEQYQQTGPSQWTDQGMPQQYMDPYQRAVTDVQKQAVVRDFNESKSTRDANAVRAGAFGGSRQGVADSLANRDLQTQLGQIEATGNQNAYTNAQQAFQADRGAAEAAKTNNLSAALQTQGLNTNAQLQAALANQNTAANQFGTLYGGQLQASLANQNAGLTAQQLAEQSKQFGANLTNQSAQFADTNQLSAQELNERLRQAALGQGLQATNQMTQQGATYADLTRLADQMQIQNTGQLQQAGAAEDARRQAGLDIGYQDFLNQKNYPYQQANFYSGILRGVPTAFNQDSVQVSQNNYNPLAQTVGSLAGIAGLFGKGNN